MMRPTSSRLRAAAALVLATVLWVPAACSSTEEPPAAKPTTPTTSATAATPAAVAPAAPPSHACYALGFAAAASPTSNADPVPCRAGHTAETIFVGTTRPIADGHLLAVDSDTVQQQIAQRCRARLARHVGGSAQSRRLSRLTVVWFSPTLAESDRGALWFRCDLVALAGHDRLAPIPGRTRGILDTPGALDRFGTCGTTSPSAARFARVICSAPHTWRARATIDLPPGARYLGPAAAAAADATCHDIDSRLADDVLRLRWSFEWPTRAQWNAGQRYGYCWTPDPA